MADMRSNNIAFKVYQPIRFNFEGPINISIFFYPVGSQFFKFGLCILVYTFWSFQYLICFFFCFSATLPLPSLTIPQNYRNYSIRDIIIIFIIQLMMYLIQHASLKYGLQCVKINSWYITQIQLKVTKK